jgi:hypothetical protein
MKDAAGVRRRREVTHAVHDVRVSLVLATLRRARAGDARSHGSTASTSAPGTSGDSLGKKAALEKVAGEIKARRRARGSAIGAWIDAHLKRAPSRSTTGDIDSPPTASAAAPPRAEIFGAGRGRAASRRCGSDARPRLDRWFRAHPETPELERPRVSRQP